MIYAATVGRGCTPFLFALVVGRLTTHLFRDGAPSLLLLEAPPTLGCFSLRSSASNDYNAAFVLSLHSPPSMSHSSMYNSHSFCHHIREFCSLLLLCHTGNSIHLLAPPLDPWYMSLFFLASPGPPPEIAVSIFSRGP